MDHVRLTRRRFLSRSTGAVSVLALGPSLVQMSALAVAGDRQLAAARIGPLLPPDANGIRLPEGFSSRIVARGGRRVQTGPFRYLDYRWHRYADGGAVFPLDDGGYVYTSNSECPAADGGGASALRFDSDGNVIDAYRILSGTSANCAGGATPWGTWLSCEEKDDGQVYECDVLGGGAVVRPALGSFNHEAAAVDPVHGHVYLTEDIEDGAFYRFTPRSVGGDGAMDLSAGRLETAAVDAATGRVSWHEVPQPTPAAGDVPTRHQVAGRAVFRGGEGLWWHAGTVYFTTKHDNRVWALDTDSQTLDVIYDAALSDDPVLYGVDNLTATAGGRLLVAEDNSTMQIVVVDRDRVPTPLLQIVDQPHSEITGPAFDPGGLRLYFSSQRGGVPIDEPVGLGLTYEITGPFDRLFA